MALSVTAAIGVDFWFRGHLDSQIERIPSAMPSGDRPAATRSDAVNMLLMGSDKRTDGSIAGERSDTMMLVHIPADRESVGVVSLPRDAWVQVPGHGPAKINAAFAWGGPALAVQTVENLTGIRLDHVAVIDWEGFKALTDVLGGVKVKIPKTVTDAYRGRTWEAGKHRMDGATALEYVRQRAGLRNGDLDRVKRQQAFLRALAKETISTRTYANPRRFYDVLDAVSKHLAVDEGWSTSDMRDLAWSLRSVRAKDIAFTTVPVRGTGMEGAQSVVYLDRQAGEDLWQAVREEGVAEWVQETGSGLGAVVD